jgi:hypothetical protein
MNLQYISGFLDADGSITISKSHKNAMFKTIKIDFYNNELNILKNIQTYFKDKHNIKLFISKKPSKKLTHSDSYTLSCSSNQKCITICNLLESIHPKKLHRINTILKYHNKVTKRNGKYSNKEITRKLAYERLFFSTNFH